MLVGCSPEHDIGEIKWKKKLVQLLICFNPNWIGGNKVRYLLKKCVTRIETDLISCKCFAPQRIIF